MAKPLFIGLDVGTTTGISIHDLNKNLLYLKSKRHFSTSNIIRQIMIFGTPVLIATDKKKTPQKIRKIAAKFNAKIYAPDHDLTVAEKEQIVNINMKDTHERDALASSLFAFKSYSSNFNTIDMNLKSLNMGRYGERVKELIVMRNAKNIAEAIEKVLPKKEEVKKTQVPKGIKIDYGERANELEKRIKKEAERYDIIREYTEKLETRIRSLEIQKNDYIEEQMKKNEEARRKVIKDKELKARDIMVKQLRYELQKERSIRLAYEEKAKSESELNGIISENLVPVVVIDKFSKEAILKAHKEHNIADKAVWIKEFKFSKAASKTLVSIGPKIVIGEADMDVKKILNEKGIIIVNTVKPKMRRKYAAVSPEEITNEIRKIEKKNILKWLQDYKKRY